MDASMSISTWIAVVGLASLSIASSISGVVLARHVGTRLSARALGLGASVGIMLAIAFGELLPESFADGGAVAMLVGAASGVTALGVLHLVIPHTHLVDEDRGVGAGSVRAAYLVVFGLILHDVPEGFAMANAYVAAPRLGVFVAIAVVVHNVPEEFAMALPAVMTGRRRFVTRAAVASAAAEPAGAVLGLISVGFFPGLHAGFLAFAAGSMIHVSLHELWPMARALRRHRASGLGVGAGVLLIGALEAAIRP